VTFGAHSEVGKLHKVMLHRPGLEHTRLTPSNAEELLFDDVLWVKKAKDEHDAFVEAMRERGVEVFHAEELLTAVENATSRPVSPVYSQISQAVFQNVNKAVAGQQSPEDALKRGQEQIETALNSF